MKIQIIGDSLTGDYGIRYGQSWTHKLKFDLKEELDVKTYNGWTTTDLLTRFNEDITSFKPSILFILAGSNDAIIQRPFQNIIRNIELMHNTAVRMGIEVFLILPPLIDSEKASSFFGDSKNIYECANGVLTDFRKFLPESLSLITSKFFDVQASIVKFIGSGKYPFTDGLHFTEDFHKYLYSDFSVFLNQIL